MPNLAALLAPAGATQQGTPCVIARVINDLPDELREQVKEMVDTPLADGGLTAEQIAARFRNAGLPGRSTSISRHRRNLCGCPTEEA